MNYQRERWDFENIAMGEGLPRDTVRRLMRHATTLQRLAVAACNGDWPCDNGERKVIFCPKCEGGFVKSSFRKGVCPDCRTEALVRALLPEGYGAVFQGDPRGAVLRITVPSGRSNCGGDPGIYVPPSRS